MAVLIVAMVFFANGNGSAQSSEGTPTRKRLIDAIFPVSEDDIGNPKTLIARIGTAIDTGADIDAADDYGNTPLFTAVYWAAIWAGDYRGPK